MSKRAPEDPKDVAARAALYTRNQKKRGFKRYTRWATDKEIEQLDELYNRLVYERKKL